jgi:hypothetical protein
LDAKCRFGGIAFQRSRRHLVSEPTRPLVFSAWKGYYEAHEKSEAQKTWRRKARLRTARDRESSSHVDPIVVRNQCKGRGLGQDASGHSEPLRSHPTAGRDRAEGETVKAILKRWSFAEQRRLIEIAASSKSFEDIVNRVGRKPDSVRKMAIRLGIILNRKSACGLKTKGK